MKKEIKIKFVGFWPGFDENDNFITKILEKQYTLHLSDAPDYIFCSVLGEPYEECNYDGIRIHWNGENYVPDFNIHDYGISCNNINFGDRHLEYPLYLINEYLQLAEQKHKNVEEEILKRKPYFCNFIYGVSREFRNQVFEKVKTYKMVHSPGSGNNNMPGHHLVKTQSQKIDFQKQCKFSIAFDSTQMPGFVTEKILHAFASQTIPIYFGAPDVSKYFNKKAFIDVADYDYDLDTVLERIIEIDEDNDLYLSILREPVFRDENYISAKQTEFENFLIHIFSQDVNAAYRRSIIAGPKLHNDRLKDYNQFACGKIYRVLRKLIR